MAVLRCPYCGERISQGSEYCNHCGKKIDKPVFSEVDTYFQETGQIFATIFKLIVLWFIILLLLGFISKNLNIPNTFAFIFSFILTFIVYVGLKVLHK